MENFSPSHKLCGLLQKCIGMQDFARIIHICHYVLETEHLAGDMVEFGCFIGHTAKMMMSISKRDMHVYDSFEGLPERNGLMKIGKQQLIDNFSDCRLPIIHVGWFKDLKPEDLPEKISLAHLDGDVYSSIMESLNLVYGRMVVGGVILIDDYGHPEWPGVKQAIEEFLANKPEKCIPLGNIVGDRGTKALVRKL